jgi:two-component system CheB/CheR fusion protein
MQKNNETSINHASKPASPRCIAGIGASAGGLEAITQFLKAMPADSGMAFVIVQHFDPASKSMATELYARRTEMTVVEAVDGAALEANHVYTIPPNKEPAIKDGRFRLTDIPSRTQSIVGPRLPIDHFFRSLADDQQEKAIAIVCSGTGCDGTLGLKSVKECGGVVLVQQPETAQFDGMPRSAIASGLVDYVALLEQMPEILQGYAHHRYPQSGNAASVDALESAIDSETLGKIFELIQQQQRYTFVGYKQKTMRRRVHRRMGLRHVDTGDGYIALLRSDPAEVTALFKDLLIGVTEFFRDAEAWQALEREVIEPLVKSKTTDEAIRVWIAGTSTGEEAYTFAMLLLEHVKAAGKRCPVHVFATDTNADALAVARAGSYPASIAAQIDPKYLERYFSFIRADDQYQVSAQLRGVVVFGLQNIFSDPPFSRVDAVSCRNLLIYLDVELQKKAILLFHFALRPNGYLFLGGAETIGSREDLFTGLSKKWRIYRRIGTTPHKQLDVRFAPISTKHGGAATLPVRPLAALTPIAVMAQQLILDRFAPAAVLVNSKYEAVYFCGPTENFLSMPKGAPTQDLISLAREGLRSRLRGALRQAALSDSSVTVNDARVKRNDSYVAVRLTVTPASVTEEHGHLLLVVFEEEREIVTINPEGANELALLKQLEDELQVTKDDLQNSIERLEISNEELKISNEEVVSVNEELQSINEELESSKEELQSLNEELNTVNQQLQSKVSELETANNDLKNLISSSEIATLCLDRNFHIKWFTPALRWVFNLVPTDVGRPISDFSSTISGADLVRDAKAVLEKMESQHKELAAGNERWFLQRILPYRADHEAVDGVIVTFSDISESKRAAEKALAEREEMLKSLEQRVEQRTVELRSLAFELTKSEERERRAVALDLHDGLGQTLAIAKIKLSNLQNEQDPRQILKAIAEVEKLIDESNQSVRSLSAQLSPAVLYDLGLVRALEWLADEMLRNHGLSCHIEDDGKSKSIDPAVRAILFRAVRELLINVVKHADVKTVRVDIGIVEQLAKQRNRSIMITIADNGKGFDPQAVTTSVHGGFGLLNIRERLAYIGGSAEVVSAPGTGTRVTLIAPMQSD